MLYDNTITKYAIRRNLEMAKRKPYQRKEEFQRKGEQIGTKAAKGFQQLDDFSAKTIISLLGAIPFLGDEASNIVRALNDSPLADLDRKKRNAVTNTAGKVLGNYWGSVLHHVTRPVFGIFDQRKPKEERK
jgi:hypothetical protein